MAVTPYQPLAVEDDRGDMGSCDIDVESVKCPVTVDA